MKCKLSTDIVNVRGTRYKILRIEDMVDPNEDIVQMGEMNEVTREIYTDADLSPQVQSETTIHEIVHAYALKSGDLSEESVIRITSAVFEFFRDNKNLAIDLINMAHDTSE